MIDFNKPIQTRSGRKVRLITADLDAELIAQLGLTTASSRFDPDNDTVLVSIGGELYGHKEDGRFYITGTSQYDLVNVPETCTVYRTLSLRDDTRTLGACGFSTLGDALHLAKLDPSIWEGVLELISEGGRLVDVKFHKVEESEGDHG